MVLPPLVGGGIVHCLNYNSPPNLIAELNPMLFKSLFIYAIGSYVSLISVANPLIAAPVFVTLTQGFTHKERATLARQTSGNVLAILLAFFIAGSFILSFFGISIHAMRIAGGLMILLSALERLNKSDRLTDEEKEEAVDKDSMAFSPLAMPLLSGPGAIAVIIGMTTDANTAKHYLIIFFVIFAVALTCYLTLKLAPVILEKLGPTLLKAFGRIMGFILLCVGVQLMINGILGLMP